MTEQQMTPPEWGDVIPFYGGDWKETVPDSKVPFYASTAIGMFMHRRIPMGRGFIPAKKVPPRLGKPAFAGGEFSFDAPVLPKELLSQAVDFFTRVYNAHKTEAAVHIMQHVETLAYRLFVPHQRLSHGGVYSIFNPAHIDPAYVQVGTIHSHCNFSAYHSGTDEADAREMDGIHLTIGNLLSTDGPHIEGMVSMNGVLFKYEGKTETGFERIDHLMDRSDLYCATAPEWWDRYLIFGQVTDADRERIAPYADNEAWDRFMGRTRQRGSIVNAPTPQTHRQPQQVRAPSWWSRHRESGELTWDVIHDDQTLAEHGYLWDAKEHAYVWVGKRAEIAFRKWQRGELGTPRFNADETQENRVLLLDHMNSELGPEFFEVLVNSGLLHSDQLDEAFINAQEAGTKAYWHTQMLATFQASAKTLRAMGFKVELANLQPPDEDLMTEAELGSHIALLPEPKRRLTKRERREARRTGAVL